MPKPRSAFCDFVLDSLASIEDVRARAMFGGYGIYRTDLMFALIAEDTLYFKVDDENRADFEAEGCGPFVYEAGKTGKKTTMSYHEAPPRSIDHPEELCRWAESGFQAARRAAGK